MSIKMQLPQSFILLPNMVSILHEPALILTGYVYSIRQTVDLSELR